jgi:pimeloyl-ACP methyl ester carboxylesterase
MTTKLICLHGFSQNGAVLRAQLGELLARLPEQVQVEVPDAPLECSPQSVKRLYAHTKGTRLPPPYRCFWDSTDDGRTYVGWEQTLELVRQLADGCDTLGLLGFSQGAIVVAALCALAEHRDFPKIGFAVLVAGRTPRSDLLLPLFERKLKTPSLHVWGQRDSLAGEHSLKLSECFDPASREVVIWPGPHVVPTRGAAADAMIAFVGKHTARATK